MTARISSLFLVNIMAAVVFVAVPGVAAELPKQALHEGRLAPSAASAAPHDRADAPAPPNKIAQEGVMGVARLRGDVKLDEPAKYALMTLDSNGCPYVSLIVTESKRVLARTAPGSYREVLRPASNTNEVYAWPDLFGRSLGVVDRGAKGAFYLLDRDGKYLAKVPALSAYNMIFSEPTRPLILSRPNGGWAGWPSQWHKSGSRDELMARDWPDGHVVKTIRFAPAGDAIAVLSNREPSAKESTISVFGPTGNLRWRTKTAPESDWTHDDIAYSNSGTMLALATRTRLSVLDRKGKTIVDMSIASPSEQHFCFSRDDKRVVLASGSTTHIIDIPSKRLIGSWDAQEIQTTHLLPAGEAHLSRVTCSRDGKTVGLAGFVSTRVPWDRPDGIRSERVEVVSDFLAFLRDGQFLDAVSLPPGTLLPDLGESRAGSKSVALSASGDEILVPSRSSIFTYAISK